MEDDFNQDEQTLLLAAMEMEEDSFDADIGNSPISNMSKKSIPQETPVTNALTMNKNHHNATNVASPLSLKSGNVPHKQQPLLSDINKSNNNNNYLSTTQGNSTKCVASGLFQLQHDDFADDDLDLLLEMDKSCHGTSPAVSGNPAQTNTDKGSSIPACRDPQSQHSLTRINTRTESAVTSNTFTKNITVVCNCDTASSPATLTYSTPKQVTNHTPVQSENRKGQAQRSVDSNVTPVRPVHPRPSPLASSDKHVSSKKKRKFPGPAGLLPVMTPDRITSVPHVETTPTRTPVQKKEADLPCSQASQDQFSESPWQTMLHDLQPQASKILRQYCVTAVYRKASRKLLPGGKVPVIGLLIESIQVKADESSAVFKDKSGAIGGTIHRHVMKEYGDQLQPGSVMLLRQVGVFSPTSKNHYLAITPNNIVRIYHHGDDQEKTSCCIVGEFTYDDLHPVEVTTPQSVTVQVTTTSTATDRRLSNNSPTLFTNTGNVRPQGPRTGYTSSPAQWNNRSAPCTPQTNTYQYRTPVRTGHQPRPYSSTNVNSNTSTPRTVLGVSPASVNACSAGSPQLNHTTISKTQNLSHGADKRFSFRKPTETKTFTPKSNSKPIDAGANSVSLTAQVPTASFCDTDQFWENDLDDMLSGIGEEFFNTT